MPGLSIRVARLRSFVRFLQNAWLFGPPNSRAVLPSGHKSQKTALTAEPVKRFQPDQLLLSRLGKHNAGPKDQS